MELNPDFQEFLRSFAAHDVRFLIVGGYALAAHGHPRYTKDLGASNRAAASLFAMRNGLLPEE